MMVTELQFFKGRSRPLQEFPDPLSASKHLPEQIKPVLTLGVN